MGFNDSPCTHTLAATVKYSTIVNTSTSQTIPWSYLDGFKPMVAFYQYFIPLSYRIMVVATTNDVGYTWPSALALMPINYIVETVPTFTTSTGSLLSEF